MRDTLFELPPPVEPELQPKVKPQPRLLTPNRAQVELRAVDLEGLWPMDHRAQIVWEYVEGLDLSTLYENMQAVEGARDTRRPIRGS